MQVKQIITSFGKGKFLKSKHSLLFALMGLAFAGGPSHADEAEEVTKLIQRSQFEQAQARADAFLANRPNDAQMRFLKGLILTERNKAVEAISVFTKLTEDFPELPEPYNNLAVLYAGRGEYEKARESLEMAIRTHPSYATAHENLGDVYAKLASQSYDKALQLDGRNSAAQTKLSLVRNLISGKPEVVASAAPAVAPAPPPAAAPVAKKPEPAEPKVALAKEEPKPVPPVARELPKELPKEQPKPTPPVVKEVPKPTPPAVEKPAAVAVAPVKPAPPALSTSKPAEPKPNSIGMDSDVLAAVEAWAKAWSGQDMAGYLNAYSQEFETPGKINRASWEKMREQRIVGKETIRVMVENPLITISGNEAVVKFKQSYFSNRLNNVSSKTLTMKLEGNTWRITSEKVGG